MTEAPQIQLCSFGITTMLGVLSDKMIKAGEDHEALFILTDAGAPPTLFSPNTSDQKLRHSGNNVKALN
jgi:hypothetical protein